MWQVGNPLSRVGHQMTLLFVYRTITIPPTYAVEILRLYLCRNLLFLPAHGKAKSGHLIVQKPSYLPKYLSYLGKLGIIKSVLIVRYL